MTMQAVIKRETVDSDRIGCVQSLVRAFGILDRLAEHERGRTLTQIAKLVSLPVSTTHRLLTTMGALRYVQFDATTNSWLVGVRAFTVGSAFAQARDLGRLARPIMRSLVMQTEETVNLGVADPQGVCFVEQVSANPALTGRVRPGVHAPLHTTALGKAMLAHWSALELDGLLHTSPLHRRTPMTIVEVERLVDQLAIVRRRGYAIDDQENEGGMRCVAAPVFDAHGHPQASLSISGPVERMGEERLAKLGRMLSVAALRMTTDLGGALAA